MRPHRRYFYRLGRFGLVLLAVLALHVVAVVWIVRSHQVTWPPAPEQIIPALLLHPEPVQPPPPPATPKLRPAPPRPRSQTPSAPVPTPMSPALDLAGMDPPKFINAGTQTSNDTGVVKDLGSEGPGGPPTPPSDTFSLPPSTTLRYVTYVNGVRDEDGVIRQATGGKSYTLTVGIPLPLFLGELTSRNTGTAGPYDLTPTRCEKKRGRR